MSVFSRRRTSRFSVFFRRSMSAHSSSVRASLPDIFLAYPEPSTRDNLFVVVGEVHNPRKLGPSETPHWLEIPERGLFTGIAILGAVGSGKSSSCMYPYAEQILAYKAHDPSRRIGGIILEVKGDFCRKVKQILDRSWPRRRLHRNQPRLRVPLQSAPQRSRCLRARLQYRILIEQSLWPRQGTVLAAGLHQSRQVHHPSAQGRVRLRHALQCI